MKVLTRENAAGSVFVIRSGGTITFDDAGANDTSGSDGPTLVDVTDQTEIISTCTPSHIREGIRLVQKRLRDHAEKQKRRRPIEMPSLSTVERRKRRRHLKRLTK